MITNLDIPLIKDSISFTFDRLEHKVDNVSKELVIKEIENLPSERDPRYLPYVSKRYNESKHTVKEYLRGNLKEFGSAENDEYKAVVLDNFEILYIKKDDVNHPVPVGHWMDWWEHDHKKYFGLSAKYYKLLPLSERASLESKLQLYLWVSIEYYVNYASFYLPKEHDKWYWDEGGKEIRGSIEKMEIKNNYWKQRLQREVSKFTIPPITKSQDLKKYSKDD